MKERVIGSSLLEMRRITKRFPGVIALDNVDFDLMSGEVHVLLGENGAGKSTLIKILAGAYALDEGEIYLAGDLIRIRNPHHSARLGISTIYQETNLVPSLSVAENIFLGRLPRFSWTGVIKHGEMVEQASRVLQTLGTPIDPTLLVKRLTIAQKQLVEIAKAVSQQTRILIMDEPTSALTSHEIENLFSLVRRLRADGTGIIYISHRFEEFHAIGDRISVMRDGRKIGTLPIAETSQDVLIQMMIGRRLEEKYPHRRVPVTEEILRVENLSRPGVFEDVSFNLHRGEILGITGVVGSGTEALAHAIAGALSVSSGEKYLHGQKVNINSPQDAIKHHIGLLTEDRKTLGLLLKLSVKENITLSSLDQISRFGWLSLAEEDRLAGRYISGLNIVTPSQNTIAENLSGGNQQKVIIAKWLCRKIDILLCVEPTRGVDIGAKVEIYNLLNGLVREGSSIIIFSSDRDEIIGMCNRALVVRKGKLVAEFPRAQFSREKISAFAFGEIRADSAASS